MNGGEKLRKHRGSLIACCVLAAFCAAAPADARPAFIGSARFSYRNEAELALAGPATLIAEHRVTDSGHGEYETNLVRSFAPGRPAKLLAVSRYDGVNAMRIAASPSRLVLLDQGQSVNQGAHGPEVGQEISEELESGPLGGPMSPLAPGCALAPGLDHGAF